MVTMKIILVMAPLHRVPCELTAHNIHHTIELQGDLGHGDSVLQPLPLLDLHPVTDDMLLDVT